MGIREVLLQTWAGGVRAGEDSSWPSGLVNQIPVDETGLETTPRAWNNIFAVIGPRAIPRKREGCLTMNATPVTGVPAIIGQYDYRWRDPNTGIVSLYRLLVSDNGRLDWMNTSGTVTTITAAAFTVGFYPPTFATLNNHAFIANGLNPVKAYQTTQQVFGIVAPNVTGTTVNAGAAGGLNGTYEVAFTFYNSVSGHESSLSATAGTFTANFAQLDVTGIPTTTDTQVTTVYVYIRNTATQNKFYQLGSTTEGTTTGSFDVAAGTTDVDLIIASPTQTSNNPPLSSIKYLAAHKNRLFAADDGNLYWSAIGDPESFDPNAADFVNANDGQKITGILSLPGGGLLITKQDSYYVLEGDVPGIWAISRLGPAVGNVSAQSLVLGSDAAYWWAEQGPVRLGFDNLTSPQLIGHTAIGATLSRRVLQYSERHRICAAFNLTGQRIIWSVPESGQTRNTRLLVWSSRLGIWESDRWDPMDAASLAPMDDANGETFIGIGGYAGQVFKLGVGFVDGVPSGTTTGTFVAGAATTSSITIAAAAFHTSGGSLVERKVTVVDSNHLVLTLGIRPRILSNSGTVLTLSSAVSGLTTGSTYTVIVGGPDWQFDTAWIDGNAAFDKKRLVFVYIMALLYGQTLYMDLLRNRKGITLEYERFGTVVGSGTLWNTTGVLWTTSGVLWNSAEITYDRLRGARTGVSFAIRCRNPYPDQSMIVFKLGLQLEMGDDKLG